MAISNTIHFMTLINVACECFRYQDGPSLSAKFNSLADLKYLSSFDTIMVADPKNGCLRAFNRSEHTVSRYAGECTQQGDKDGNRLEAQFSYPNALLMDNDKQLLYILDRPVLKIKMLSMVTDEVLTWLTLPSGDSAMGFSFPPAGRESVLILQDNAIYENTPAGIRNILGTPTTSEQMIRRIVSLSPRIHLITNKSLPGVQLFDSGRRITMPLCEEKMSYSSKIHAANCSLNSQSIALMVSGGYVHIPGLNDSHITVKSLKGSFWYKVY